MALGTPNTRPDGWPVYRTFLEALDGHGIGYAATVRDCVRVAIGAGVTGLKHGTAPQFIPAQPEGFWLLDE